MMMQHRSVTRTARVSTVITPLLQSFRGSFPSAHVEGTAQYSTYLLHLTALLMSHYVVHHTVHTCLQFFKHLINQVHSFPHLKYTVHKAHSGSIINR